jgi:cobalt-zinc-cadmium efflux system membrane fusion protein
MPRPLFPALPFVVLGASLALAACERPTAPERSPVATPITRFLRIEAVGLDARGAALVAEAEVTFDEERVAAIIAPVQGRVMRLLAAPGDHVAAGAPLATIYSAEVAGAGAGLSQARINRTAAEQSLRRAERLVAEGAGSQRDAVDARTALANARAEEVRAAAVLQSMGAAGVGAGTFTLRAPIPGTIVRRALRVGVQARPDAAEPAFLIADLDRVWVLAHLHEAQGAAVRAGDVVEVDVPALPGRRFNSVVDRVAEAVDPNAHTLEVRIRVPNPDHALKPEMFARVTLRTGSAGVAVTPISALITDADGYAVFVEDAPGHFERRHVVVGAEFNGQAQVRAGLRVGERVVVEGALLLDASAERVL